MQPRGRVPRYPIRYVYLIRSILLVSRSNSDKNLGIDLITQYTNRNHQLGCLEKMRLQKAVLQIIFFKKTTLLLVFCLCRINIFLFINKLSRSIVCYPKKQLLHFCVATWISINMTNVFLFNTRFLCGGIVHFITFSWLQMKRTITFSLSYWL